MDSVNLPQDCAKQWEILLLLMASEEQKIDRTKDNEVDTMSYFLQNEGVNQILLQWLQQMKTTYAKKMNESDTALKCDDVSLWWRQKGNEKFKANAVEDSYKCYTKSVIYANQNGPMYPLALANRSASLLRLKRFKECLSDIQLAISAGYPTYLQYKLMLRYADCYIELNELDKAVEALSSASQQAMSVKLNTTQTDELNRHIKALEKKMEVFKSIEPSVEEIVVPECCKGENQNFVAASSVLELRRSDEVGRHVVTREPLRRGDVVFSEEPYAWVALPSEVSVCEGCCATDINLVPCETCSRSVYCNEECRTQAFVYHRWECVGAQANLFPTIGIAHLTLRVLLTSAINGFPNVPANSSVPTNAAELFRSYADVDDIEIYKNDTPPFYRMFNLITNFKRMNNMDYIQYALTATMLTLYLEKFTEFFEWAKSRVPYALERAQLRLFAAALMLRSLGQLVCNGHAALSLADVDDLHSGTVTEREVRRATAIYPSAAMMNHSCDPNIVNTFHKGRLVVVCGREVCSGAALENCYGPHRARDTTSRRRQLLRAQYLFTCSCAACLDINNRDFVLLFSAYACGSCKGPVVRDGRRTCPHCHAPFHPNTAAQILDQAETALTQAEHATSLEERIEKTQASFRLKQQVWYRHNSQLRSAADHLARLYADHGDFNKSIELIKQNIQSLEYQFGSFSVEVAHELRKLSDVMLERIVISPQSSEYREWCLETHKITKKAVQVMVLNYGAWEAASRRLAARERFAATLLADSRASDVADVHHSLHYNLKI